jgi:4-carboxymuconolactone decarboxylase
LIPKYVLLIGLMAICSPAPAADRFPVPDFELMTPEQKSTLEAIIAGPRGGAMTPEIISRVLDGGPFNAWLSNLDLGNRLQRIGEYIRFKTSLDLRLNEFAILITARHWTSQYEWFAHLPLAIKAGLDPNIAAQLARGKRPSGMKDDEAVVYDFSTQLHRHFRVNEATFQRALKLFGRGGVIDLIGVNGYYAAVSMTLNVAEVPLPPGEKPPLMLLK